MATYLAAQGPYVSGTIVLSTAEPTPNLYTVPLPLGAPDPAVHVVVWGGEQGDRGFGPSLTAPVNEKPTFQVFGRGTDGAQVRQLMFELSKKLENLGPVTLSGVEYRDVMLLAPSHFIRRNEEDLFCYGFDCEACKDRS